MVPTAVQHGVELVHLRPRSPLLDPGSPGIEFPWGIRTEADLALHSAEA
jgi:hypothetical protein